MTWRFRLSIASYSITTTNKSLHFCAKEITKNKSQFTNKSQMTKIQISKAYPASERTVKT